MIGYTTLGTNDFDRACAFYDGLFASIGEKRIMEIDNFVVWGTSMEQPGFSITRPFDGKPATVGNGVMIALQMPSREAVDAFYAKAIAQGASDEGAPGDRGDGFYAAYFRDLDGNKLNAFVMG
tara:strand:+ start:32657 stop:33025 length:369 start_codon:yes stop_codon:yes gene_type:complete